MKSLVKVGLFATVCLVIVAILIWKIEDFNPFKVKGQRFDAVFPSVAGLDDKASVRVAGVRVGSVDGVGLQGTRARITLALDKPLPLTQGTTARIANLGLLGEKYVELVPGPPDAPPLPENAVLGVEAPLWTETVENITAAQFLLVPRLPAIAEIGWSAPATRDWESFRTRIAGHAPRWRLLGINYWASPQVEWQ